MKHLLTLKTLGTDNLLKIINRSFEISQGKYDSLRLQQKILGVYFRCSSTRTRTSFTVGALKLGIKVISYGEKDLQIITGETVNDTALVLSQYLDGLVIRTNGEVEEMEALTNQSGMAIINAMNEIEHPTQAIADLSTILSLFGKLENLHLVYIGEGNNTAIALAYAFAQLPLMKLTIVTPESYGVPPDILLEVSQLTEKSGAQVNQHHNINDLPEKVDLVYATRWQTMGVTKPDKNWLEKFAPFKITAELMRKVSKPDKTYFMHDLPAVREVDVASEVLDGQQSRAFLQAQHKLFSAMAVLEWCLSEHE
jgi:ornithine carbamoyltransferase